MLICSNVFQPLAAAEARSLGLPDMRMVVVPHPIGSFSSDELLHRGVPQAALERLLEVLSARLAGSGQE